MFGGLIDIESAERKDDAKLYRITKEKNCKAFGEAEKRYVKIVTKQHHPAEPDQIEAK